jgi:hypothetical protein
MAFNPGGGGGISGASDVALSSVANNHILSYNGAVAKWHNQAITADTLPAGCTLTVYKTADVWPARPTARTDITVQWRGSDPSPAIVSSGTGGMLDNVDVRLVTP